MSVVNSVWLLWFVSVMLCGMSGVMVVILMIYV